jgi:hypothetical protein
VVKTVDPPAPEPAAKETQVFVLLPTEMGKRRTTAASGSTIKSASAPYA